MAVKVDDRKVEVRTAGKAGVAGIPDELTLGDLVAHVHGGTFEVEVIIDADCSVAVIDAYKVAVGRTGWIGAAGVGVFLEFADDSSSGGMNGGADLLGEVDRIG